MEHGLGYTNVGPGVAGWVPQVVPSQPQGVVSAGVKGIQELGRHRICILGHGKGSTASAGSTQNSEVSGSEALDSLGHVAISLVVPGPAPSLSAQPELALEKTVPVTAPQQQMGYDMQQTGIPSQMGFPRQLLGTVGPVFNQQHIIAGAPTQQFVPAHGTMTPPPCLEELQDGTRFRTPSSCHFLKARLPITGYWFLRHYSRFDDCLYCCKSLSSCTLRYSSARAKRESCKHKAVEQQGAAVGQRIVGSDGSAGAGKGQEHPKVSVPPQGMIGQTGTVQTPYGVFVGAVPQPRHVNATEQLLVPSQYQVKQEVAANKPVNSDFLKVGGMPGQTLDNLTGESPKNYGGTAPTMLLKKDDIESVTAYNHLRQIEGRMENLPDAPAEIIANNEQTAEGYEVSPADPVMTDPGVHAQPNYGVINLIPGENSNSLYSYQDPWNLQHDAHFPPPKPSKLQLKKEAAGTKDYSGENCFGNSSELPTITNGGLQTQSRLEDGAYLPSGNTDYSSDQSWSKKGSEEEMIKQELQAVAEGVKCFCSSVINSI
ncbi:hypothetical protein HAX54_013834 [Datura stramonium]|uniref:Uncharacterized protein n=1 Tax=Datura stramonium TaxID=4076 RepID=A0ABS8TNZ6_DATST|nr:hypothetical protein [Datura stramonium]